MLEGRVIKLMVWGLKVEFIKFYGFMLRDVFRFERVWDGEFVGLFWEGIYCNERERFLLSEK